jgi:hypothetical protein
LRHWIGTVHDAIYRTLFDLAEFLEAQRIPFAVIGGIATVVRGEPRFTADVDVVIGADLAAATALTTALDTTPFQPLFPGIAEVVQTAFILPVRHRETQVKVDMAIGLTGFERQLIGRATQVMLAGRPIPVATAEDLILLKLLAGRPRDTDDVQGIVARNCSSLDWDYLLETARLLQEAVAQDLVSPLLRMRGP